MEITILKSYNNNKDKLHKHRVSNPEGKTLEEIILLEEELNQGNHFPKVFREYLFIGGKYNALGFNDGINGNFIGLRKFYDKKLKEYNISINRPFIIFHNHEGEVFSFIYLDEGDNPQPWNCTLKHDNNNKILKTPFSSFSNLVNDFLESALEGLPAF